MSGAELNHLIKMLNQISDNIAIGEDETTTAQQVADHVKRFWAPAMRNQVLAYAKAGGDQLNRVSLAALELLNP